MITTRYEDWDFSTWEPIFRLTGSPGDPYPPWVAEHRGRSGVYLLQGIFLDDPMVRQPKQEKVLLYVGESHTGRLVETAIRHLRRWNEQRDAGGRERFHNSYIRETTELCLLPTPTTWAQYYEAVLIERFKPRDNVRRPDPTRVQQKWRIHRGPA